MHIPFCARKCAYCDFVSYPAPDMESLAPAYLHAVLVELRLRQDELRRLVPISTVYVGGGTPTCVPRRLLAAFIEQLLQEAVSAATGTTATATAATVPEVTVEANPGTVNFAGLAALRAAGANRLSLGFQSLSDSELAALGRMHSAADCLRAFTDARAAGFDNMSVDLILGSPGQTPASLERTTDSVIALDPEHVSAYCLSLEPGTPLADAVASGAVAAPDDDSVADLYNLFVARMAASGRARYEISNFARPGFESRHNMGYWRNGQYIGLGVAAHSHLRLGSLASDSAAASACAPALGSASGFASASVRNPAFASASDPATCWGIRSWNTPSVDDYVDSIGRGCLPVAGREMRTQREEARDALMVGLRTADGVDLGALSQEYGVDLVGEYSERFRRLARRGLVEVSDPALGSGSGAGPALGPHVRLAPNAFLVANQVFVECV